MKYIVFLGDGMADTPVEALEGKTPLMVAKKPHIDSLAPMSEVGIAKTVPDGMKPGSDTANLSVMGYDPRTCYSGRSPLEALSMGLTLSDTDIAVRCNLVTLSSEEEHYADKRMVDYSAGEISTQESGELIRYVQEHLGNDKVSFHPGISYRHCLIVHEASVGSELTPPHDITGKGIKRYLPAGILGDLFLDLQMRSYELLKDHPINLQRIAKGKNPANSVWFWGEGTKPNIPDFEQKNGIKGAVISAVDLLKGIGKGAGMEVIEVAGATGNVHTDFAAKGRAAIDALKRGVDYVYIHVEAPDESGHQGSLSDKITSIEKIDSDIVGPVLSYLKESGEPYHVLVCPDHPTPLATRTHSAEPIPYLIYRSDAPQTNGPASYDEESAKTTEIFTEGYRLIDRLLSSEGAGDKGISPSFVTMPDSGVEIRLDGEADSAPKQEEPEAPPAEEPQAPSKKNGKFLRFFKKHLLIFSIAIAVILLAAGLVAGHFIATYHLSFVDSEEELREALSKSHVTTIVFKDNVKVSSDLTFSRPVDLDLNGYTLTVNGKLSIPVKKQVSIGTRKDDTYAKSGKIAAKSLSVVGTGKLRYLADLQVSEATFSASSMLFKANVSGDSPVLSLDSDSITFDGKVSGEIRLSDRSVMTYGGNVREIRGGKKVTLKSGKADALIGSDQVATQLYVYEGASVGKVMQAGGYYRVSRLKAPDKITVLEEEGEFRCYVSEVIGATHFSYSLNGKALGTVPMTKGRTLIVLSADKLSPGKQTLRIKAIAENDDCLLDSAEKTQTFEFSARLDSPKISVVEKSGAVILNVASVKNADGYLCKVGSSSFTVTSGENDITDKVTAGGVHVVEVKAKSENKYFSDSHASMYSYVHYLSLESPLPTASLEEDLAVFSWDAIEGASDYMILYDGQTVYTTEPSIRLTYAPGADFTVKARGTGYYKDSVAATVKAEEIPTPEEDA